MDLHENSANNSVTATFELPGMQKEGVSIDVHNGRLTVSGETKMSSEHEESGYAVRERKYGKFARTLQLPQGVKVSFYLRVYITSADDDLIGGRDQGVNGERGFIRDIPQVRSRFGPQENQYRLKLECFDLLGLAKKLTSNA